MREFRDGDRVRLPDGTITRVLGHAEGGAIVVRLDGEATGAYPAEALTAAESEET